MLVEYARVSTMDQNTSFSVFAEFERSPIRERSSTRLSAARERGVRLGRPQALIERQRAALVAMVERGVTKTAAARRLSVHLSTVTRVLRLHRVGVVGVD